MNTIFVSCGHNAARNLVKNESGRYVLGLYKDYGAIDPKNRDNTEYRWVRKVANQIFKMGFGTTQEHVIHVVPEGLNLNDRISYINKRAIDGDICIELHMNSGGGTGCEVFAHGQSTYALKKAASMSQALATTLKIKNRGAKPDTQTRFGSLGFIRQTKPLAFLIELGFIDNSTDRDQVWVSGAQAVIDAIESI